jgi:hypothetical protein
MAELKVDEVADDARAAAKNGEEVEIRRSKAMTPIAARTRKSWTPMGGRARLMKLNATPMVIEILTESESTIS